MVNLIVLEPPENYKRELRCQGYSGDMYRSRYVRAPGTYGTYGGKISGQEFGLDNEIEINTLGCLK